MAFHNSSNKDNKHNQLFPHEIEELVGNYIGPPTSEEDIKEIYTIDPSGRLLKRLLSPYAKGKRLDDLLELIILSDKVTFIMDMKLLFHRSYDYEYYPLSRKLYLKYHQNLPADADIMFTAALRNRDKEIIRQILYYYKSILATTFFWKLSRLIDNINDLRFIMEDLFDIFDIETIVNYAEVVEDKHPDFTEEIIRYFIKIDNCQGMSLLFPLEHKVISDIFRRIVKEDILNEKMWKCIIRGIRDRPEESQNVFFDIVEKSPSFGIINKYMRETNFSK